MEVKKKEKEKYAEILDIVRYVIFLPKKTGLGKLLVILFARILICNCVNHYSFAVALSYYNLNFHRC